eukprot:TCALIF_07299-PA protein Name:"Similar to GMCL1 Germ cell-less protein-like 1 (Homo sapiens)" AED:0.26 eAED:0.26 QI:0/0/0/0.6/1/1/5/0/330
MRLSDAPPTMGARFSGPEVPAAVAAVPDSPPPNRRMGKRRRRGSSSSGGSTSGDRTRESQLERYLSTPTPKKLQTTSKYIYDTLFTAAHQSDVSVAALGQVWPLHKVSLHTLTHERRSSGQFSSQTQGHTGPRSGLLLARQQKFESMAIIPVYANDTHLVRNGPDARSRMQVLDQASLGWLRVISVLATATLLQMESLIQKCREIMVESLNYKTASAFLTAAETYGLREVREECVRWLQVNLLHHMPERPEALREISPAILQEAIGSTDLFVLQTEVSVYGLLRLWTFLRIHPDWKGDANDVVQQPHMYFVVSTEKCFRMSVAFLDQEKL